MIYFFDQSIYENQNFKIKLNFEKKLSKPEKEFLNLLLEDYSIEKNDFTTISIKKILSTLKLKKDELNNFLKKFTSKKITYAIFSDNSISAEGSFYILSSYTIQNKENFIFSLAKEIQISYEKNNFFHKLKLYSILKFKNNYSLDIYLMLLNTTESQIILDLEEFKENLGSRNSYSRYYDLEKYVLKPICEDINSNTEFEIDFSKIKKSNAASSKIIGITLNFYNKLIQDTKIKTNELIAIVKDEIISFDIAYDIIYASLINNGEEYVYNNLIYAKENYKDNFEKFLNKALLENLYKTNLKVKRKNEIVIKKKIKNHIQLHEEINTTLLKFNTPELLNPNLVGPKFYRDLHKLKDGDEISFKNDHVIIEIYYHTKQESQIKIAIV